MEEKLRQYSEHLEELVKKGTEELLESEKRYSILVDEASDGVVIHQDGKIVFANKKALDLAGYSRKEQIGLPPEKLVTESPEKLKDIYERRMRGEEITSEVEVRTKTGESIPVETTGSLITYQGRPAVLVIIRDVRQRKQMEEQRLRLEKLAALSELAMMVGHDLRNPLQSIENATYVLKNEFSKCTSEDSIQFPQKVNEMFQVIADSTNYADKILRDLQDFSATKAPRLRRIDVNTLVEEALSQVEAPQKTKLHAELSRLPEIEIDRDQMKRVFMNLILNGMQAMEKGGTLLVSTKKSNGFVEIGFKDTGVGISKENMEKLFKPFFTTKATGTGMGLSICKKFVENHRGSIKVESELGKGTTFTVKLPAPEENECEK
jgi:PAS domain S-box-containing protein